MTINVVPTSLSYHAQPIGIYWIITHTFLEYHSSHSRASPTFIASTNKIDSAHWIVLTVRVGGLIVPLIWMILNFTSFILLTALLIKFLLFETSHSIFHLADLQDYYILHIAHLICIKAIESFDLSALFLPVYCLGYCLKRLFMYFYFKAILINYWFVLTSWLISFYCFTLVPKCIWYFIGMQNLGVKAAPMIQLVSICTVPIYFLVQRVINLLFCIQPQPIQLYPSFVIICPCTALLSYSTLRFFKPVHLVLIATSQSNSIFPLVPPLLLQFYQYCFGVWKLVVDY